MKNHSLELEAPYRYGSETRKYRPDFIAQIDDGNDDPLNLIVEIKQDLANKIEAECNRMVDAAIADQAL